MNSRTRRFLIASGSACSIAALLAIAAATTVTTVTRNAFAEGGTIATCEGPRFQACVGKQSLEGCDCANPPCACQQEACAGGDGGGALSCNPIRSCDAPSVLACSGMTSPVPCGDAGGICGSGGCYVLTDGGVYRAEGEPYVCFPPPPKPPEGGVGSTSGGQSSIPAEPSAPASDDGGCSFSPHSVGLALSPALLALLAALVLARRREAKP